MYDAFKVVKNKPYLIVGQGLAGTILAHHFLAAQIPFEIWDSANDPLFLHTLPQRLGIPKTKILGYGLLIPFLILIAWQSNRQGSSLVVALLTALSIYFTTVKRSMYYTSFWVESVPIVWWFFLLFC